ncbi:MAG TPA: hypothetical protein DCX07_08455 [Phycisphaerales bacterium]|nr:hypothetical protein [Phycisphaerales bacterium]
MRSLVGLSSEAGVALAGWVAGAFASGAFEAGAVAGAGALTGAVVAVAPAVAFGGALADFSVAATNRTYPVSVTSVPPVTLRFCTAGASCQTWRHTFPSLATPSSFTTNPSRPAGGLTNDQ